MARRRKISCIEAARLYRNLKRMSMQEIEKYLGLTIEEEAMLTGKTPEEVFDWRYCLSTTPKREIIEILDTIKEQFPIGTTFEAAKYYGITVDEVLVRIRNGNITAFKTGNGRYRVWLKA